MVVLVPIVRRATCFFFFVCEPNLLGFFGVLLLGFSDLLILFLGFVVQIGLLDLGIRLDGKKISNKMQNKISKKMQ